jgi:hypothetical protein
MIGKYADIALFPIHFDNDLLHRAASDDINLDLLFEPGEIDTLSLNAIDYIHREVITILARECTQTMMTTRMPQLVNVMSMTHKTKTGQLRCIRTSAQITSYMDYAIKTNMTEFALTLGCNGLHFRPDFNGLNLDHVNTQPFPPSSLPVTSTTRSLFPLLHPVTPPADIFNYRALPSDMLQQFDDHQNPSVLLGLEQLNC